MRKILLIAALMMTTSLAHAGDSVSFMINGQRVRIERPRNCMSLSCINIVAPGLTNSSSDDSDTTAATTSSPAPATAPAAPMTASTPAAVSVAAPAPGIPPLPAQVPAATSTTAATANVTSLSAPAATTPVEQSAAAPAAATPQSAAPQSDQQPRQVASLAPASAVAPAAGPVGMWMTEKNEGKVHVVNCGANICGYAVDKKTGGDGAQVLINMKPNGNGWHGRIHDTRGGGTYDSTLAMRGNDRMRVQGCAFGGMFCGGQTWTRVN